MPHLTLEALARLVDEAPTTEESRHLDGCPYCADELAALRDQTDALASLPKMAPPPDLWPELRTRLRDEGLVQGATERRSWTPALTRLAAALALFVAGSATGFVARGTLADAAPVTGTPVAAAPARDGGTAGSAATRTSAEPSSPRQGFELTSSGDVAADVERAQQWFSDALDRYMMENNSAAPDPAARLAALDNIVMTTAEALNESPADPVINSYHLTAVAQRNALLRQIAASRGEPVF